VDDDRVGRARPRGGGGAPPEGEELTEALDETVETK
jgi:hypothetical protein